MEDLNIHQKIVLKKDGTEQSLSYQNNNQKIYRTLNENEFDVLFNKLRPNIDFSLPDRLIQSFVKDGTILPSYKNSRFFNMDDFDSIVTPLKRDMPLLSKLQKGDCKRKNRRPGLGSITMKKGKQSSKDKLLKQLKVNRKKSTTEKKIKKVNTKSSGKGKRVNKNKSTGSGKRKGDKSKK